MKFPKPSPVRGGSFFTMLIFIMMLLSTALMYYYFQRTQFLERQLSAMQNGEPVEQSSLSSLVSWIKGDDNTAPSAITQAPVSAEPPKSTPRPAAIVDALNTPPTDTNLQPEEQTTITESIDTTGDDTLSAESNVVPDTLSEDQPRKATPVETEGPSQPINSLYDSEEAPSVRVRSPQRR